MEDKETGNPEAVDNAVFGSETSFFDALEDDVNGVVADEAEAKVEETPQSVDPNTTEPTSTQEVSDTPQEKIGKRGMVIPVVKHRK